MRHREFLIDPNDATLEFYETLDEEYARSLCVNHFDIPQECISKIKCYDDIFKVYLVHSRRYFNEDWYVNLSRLEQVS